MSAEPIPQELIDQATDLNKRLRKAGSPGRPPRKRRRGNGTQRKRALRAELRRVEKRLDNAVAALTRVAEATTDDPGKLRKIAKAGCDWEAKAQAVQDDA